MKRSYALDVLKLVLAYVVAFHHVGTALSPGPTVAVQIFFMISGFFLGRKFYARQDSSYTAWQYTLDHARGLYPHYLLSQGMLFAYLLARALLYFFREPTWEALQEIALSFYNQLPDLFLVQSAYTYHPSINYPAWQISALLIAGYFVFALLRWQEQLSRRILFPAAILMILSLLNTGVDLWSNYGPLYLPLLRAFGPMCMGVLTWYFTTTAEFAALRRHKRLMDLAGIASVVCIFAFGEYYQIFFLCTGILLLSCTMEDSLLNRLLSHRRLRRCGKLSYAIYLNQALVERFVCARLFPNQALGTRGNAVFFLLLTAYSLLTMTLVEMLSKKRISLLQNP